MIYKDYYKDLGVEKTATPAEIKKAYRTLANKYHPDKNDGAKSAEERFKIISEANEVLKDPIKRKKYDQFGAEWKHYQESGAKPGGFDWSKYTSGNGGQTHRTGRYESNTIFDDEGVNDLYEILFGQRSGQQRRRQSVVIKGEDLATETSLSLYEAYHGTARLIQLHGQKIKVTINPGVSNNQKLRIPGKGGNGLSGGPNGDLYLNVKIASHHKFQRNGNNLYADLPVNLYTAILGGKTEIISLKGNVTINIPKGTQNGKELRLKGLGMPVYGKNNEFGNMFVKVGILLPEQLSEDELDMFRKLAVMQK